MNLTVGGMGAQAMGLTSQVAGLVGQTAGLLLRQSALTPAKPGTDVSGHGKDYTPSVFFSSEKAMVMRSRTTHVHGDKPGKLKGVTSHTVEDATEPIGHAAQVRAEGSHVIRRLDRFWMNCRNTAGEAVFVCDTKTYPAPKDDDPVPGSLRAKAKSDDGRVMSDASPEPLVMGAQYAQASPATVPQAAPGAVPQPAPGPAPGPAPSTPPGVGGPGNVIRGPWAPRTPPPTLRVPLGTVPTLLRYGKYGILVLPLMLSGDTPLIPPLPRGSDSVEEDLNKRAQDMLHPFEHSYNE